MRRPAVAFGLYQFVLLGATLLPLKPCVPVDSFKLSTGWWGVSGKTLGFVLFWGYAWCYGFVSASHQTA
ncbi:hypothetical protein CCANI_11700 [Corynebacterium canis]|nr:hypothetical protein CCANI_11700 [Corynebacterium canis]